MNKESDNYSIAGRYRTVRKHLDALGYKQALSLDSLPLIELLLVDLAQTKESLKHFQSIAKDNLEACSQLQLAIDPYKCDNAKLVQECNRIHLELIETKETHQKQCNDYKKQIRKLESELSDLQLSFSRNLQRIKQLETESSNKSKKILELQGKCCKPIVNNVNLATKKRACYPLRRPTLEAESLPRTSSTTTTTTFSTKNVQPYVVDFMSIADHRISCLSNEVTKLKEELFLSNEHIETLKSQLNSKEKEMSRLRQMLEGGRPCSSINKDHCCITSEKINGYQRSLDNDDLYNFQQIKLSLEQQLKEALNKQHDAMAQAMKLAERNEELEKELKNIDRLALAVEADCNSTVKENNRRVCRLQEKLEDVMTQVHVLESELTVQRREAQELRADLEACRLEKSNVQRALESTLEEKKQMTDRINNLTIMASKSPDKGYQEKKKETTQSDKPKECSCRKEVIDEASQCNMDRLIHEKNVIIESLQNTIERIESERDYYKSEYVKFKDQFKQDTEKDNQEGLWSQICELRAQMSEKEHAISKLLREKKELCQEKFSLESRLHAYQSQQRSNSPCNYCRCRSPSLNERKNTSISNKIEKLEHERDAARADVERLIEERDALRERLKETRRAAISGLEEQHEDLKEDLRRTKQELNEQRTQYFQLRTLQDQTDQALGDVQSQLTHCENELSGALDRNKNLERQQLQLDNQIKDLRQEINTHRSRMAQLDREKDQLLMDLDERTEKIAALEREIDYKDQHINTMEQEIRELSRKKEICIDQAADVERQMRSMQLDMDNLQRQLSSVSMERENVIQENRRLQDDLAAVSCEVRSILKELDASKAESQDLKRQLQTYVSEVRRAEELLSQKENERTEMLEHYRSLSLEATVLENNNHSLETEAAEARGALQSARDQIVDLERRLSDKDCLIRGYEAQITELTQNVASLEIQMQQATEQRIRAEEDLRTVRDLCMTLEQQKESISKRLEENTDLKTKYEVQLSTYRSEQQIFQDQMNKDHVRIDRLERLLEEARKETIAAQTNCRELQSEVSRLKHRISELQNKLSAETVEVRKYQTQAAEYSKQISELRRQVSNERFERARMREESQRYNKALVPKIQGSCKYESNNEDVGKISCNACTCSSSSGGNEACSGNFKVQITEMSPKSNGIRSTTLIPDDKSGCCANNYNVHNCCQENQQQLIDKNLFCKKNSMCHLNTIANYQNLHSACFCSEKTLRDVIGYSQNTNFASKKLGLQNDILKRAINNKAFRSSSASSDNSIKRCGRCGGRKKQKQNGIFPYWIIEILDLINKILEEKRKAQSRKCVDGKGGSNEVAIQIVQEGEKNQALSDKNIKSSDDKVTTTQSIKYSLIERCNSNCTVSTQTIENVVTVSDISMPNLLKILADVQHYAKSIEKHIYALAASKQRNDCISAEPSDTQSVPVLRSNNEAPEKLIPSEFVDASLPTEQINKLTFQDKDLNLSDISVIPFSSTPRKSKTTLDSNADDSQPLNLPLNLENEIENVTEHLALPRRQQTVPEEDLVDSNLDTTEYTEPPKITRPTSKEWNATTDGSVVEFLKDQVEEVNTDMKSIQEKIERLRRDIFNDVDSHARQKNNKKM